MTIQTYGDNDPADRSETSQIAELSRRTLGSEQVVLDAPMSFTGQTKRTLRFTRNYPATRWRSQVLATTGLVPYRLIRRSQRRDEQRWRQHAGLLAGQRRQGWR
jgi:hypothetical protein